TPSSSAITAIGTTTGIEGSGAVHTASPPSGSDSRGASAGTASVAGAGASAPASHVASPPTTTEASTASAIGAPGVPTALAGTAVLPTTRPAIIVAIPAERPTVPRRAAPRTTTASTTAGRQIAALMTASGSRWSPNEPTRSTPSTPQCSASGSGSRGRQESTS